MAVGDIWQVTNEFTYQKNPNTYSFNLRVTAEGDPAALATNLLDFGATRQLAWLALHNPSVLFECISARLLYPNTGLPHIRITDTAGNRSCTPILDHLPGQCSCVVTLYGDVDSPTASNRGRDFITGQCCVDQSNGIWENGPGDYLEKVCEYYALMGNTYTPGPNSFDIGIFSPTRAGITVTPHVPATPPYFWPLIFVRARSLVRTQRRRQPEGRCEFVCESNVEAPAPT